MAYGIAHLYSVCLWQVPCYIYEYFFRLRASIDALCLLLVLRCVILIRSSYNFFKNLDLPSGESVLTEMLGN